MMRQRCFSLGVILFFVLMGMPTAQAQLKVVVTFSILGDLVRQVAGDKADIHVLVGANGDVHTYEPNPKDGVLLAQADLVVENGLHYEAWLDDLYEASQSKARRVVVTQAVQEQAIRAQHPSKDHGFSDDMDPHAWHSIALVKDMVGVITRALMEKDPKQKDFYETSSQLYLAQLDATEQWVKEQVALIPRESRKLMTSHNTLGYFAKAYGFDIVGNVISSATTEASDPSAKDIAALVKAVKEAGVKAIFTENIASSHVVESLAKEAHVMVAPPLYTDALGEKGSPADTYVKMMRYNVSTIVHALKSEKSDGDTKTVP